LHACHVEGKGKSLCWPNFLPGTSSPDSALGLLSEPSFFLREHEKDAMGVAILVISSSDTRSRPVRLDSHSPVPSECEVLHNFGQVFDIEDVLAVDSSALAAHLGVAAANPLAVERLTLITLTAAGCLNDRTPILEGGAEGRALEARYRRFHIAQLVLLEGSDLNVARAYIGLAEIVLQDHPQRGGDAQGEPAVREADDLLQQACRLLDAVRDDSIPEADLSRIGRALLDLGDLGASETQYVRCLKLQEERLKPMHLDVSSTCAALAAINFERGKADVASRSACHEKAILYYCRALDIHSSIRGEDNMDVLRSCIALSQLYRSSNKDDQADSFGLRAIDIGEQIHVADDSMVNIAVSLGESYLRRGMLEQANVMYRKAIASSTALLGWDHEQTTKAVYGLGLVIEQCAISCGKKLTTEEKAVLLYEARMGGTDAARLLADLEKRKIENEIVEAGGRLSVLMPGMPKSKKNTRLELPADGPSNSVANTPDSVADTSGNPPKRSSGRRPRSGAGGKEKRPSGKVSTLKGGENAQPKKGKRVSK